ncbi:TPA: thrombospondin type 3 repeat-containing protein [Streptococcus suis]|nr:thrombospondin type 3 repeat-containing protein [Streptococcus suis]
MAPEQQLPITAGTHTVTVRVITDSNVYKDVPVTVTIPEVTVIPVDIADFKEGDTSVVVTPRTQTDKIFLGIQGNLLELLRQPDGTYTANNAAGITVTTDTQIGAVTINLPAGQENPGVLYELVDNQTLPTSGQNNIIRVKAKIPHPTVSNSFQEKIVQVIVSYTSMTSEPTPSYGAKSIVPGTPATSTPAFTDANGQPIAAPTDTRYEIPVNFQAPAGYTAEIDQNTGDVTVTAAKGTSVESIEVPVKVTYPEDGSSDTATAVFKLDTDGDGLPDVTDENDDNDGILDKDDKEPKVPNTGTQVNTATVVEGQPVPDGTKVITPESPKTMITPSTPVSGTTGCDIKILQFCFL